MILRSGVRRFLLLSLSLALCTEALFVGAGMAARTGGRVSRSADWGFEATPDPALLERWPDAKSCLPLEESGKDKPDLTEFDWSSIENDDHARVCLYRIAS